MTDQAPVDPNAPLPVSAAELDEIFSGPAFYVNKTYLTATGLTVRLTFAEQRRGEGIPAFRTAVVMTVDDLAKLRDVMNRILAHAATVSVQPPEETNG